MMKKFVLFVIIYFSAFFSFSQNKRKLDSLLNELKKREEINDTIKANLFEALCTVHLGNNLEKAKYYTLQSLNLSKKLGFKRGIGTAYNSLGSINDNKGDYPQALGYYEKALAIFKEINYKKGIASVYNNIGNIYYLMCNYSEALKNHLISLKLKEEMGNAHDIAGAYNNIGSIYFSQWNLAEALKYFQNYLLLAEQNNDVWGIGASCNNIGSVYHQQKNYNKALEFYYKSLKARQEVGDKSGISISYANIALSYIEMGNAHDAEKNILLSLNIRRELEDKNGVAECYAGLSEVYIMKKDYNKAVLYAGKCLEIGQQIGALDWIRTAYKNLANANLKKGDAVKAYEYRIKFEEINDSMFNIEKSDKIKQLVMQYDFDRKEAIAKEKADNELREQKLYTNGGISVIIIVSILLFFVFRNYKKQIWANRMLKEAQGQIIESEKSAALQSVRNKISQDLHDDIGSALSSITMYSEVAKNILKEKNEDTVSLLDTIQQTTKSAMESMSDIVWAINPKHDKFSNITERLGIFVNQLLGAKDINIHFKVPDDLNEIQLSMPQRKNIYLICKEAVNNIAKYADAKNCIIEILKENGKININISDDGKGMDEEKKSLGGNGLLNMKTRAEELMGSLNISSEKNKGTILSLTFAL